MKQLQLLLLLILTSTLLVAQVSDGNISTCGSSSASGAAPLPTFWDFSTTDLPVGFTEMGTSFYDGTTIACGTPAKACRLDADGDFVMVHVADEMGTITFTLRGTGSQDGVFEVQESVTGDVSDWTTTMVYNNMLPNSCATQTINLMDANSRYVRFILVDKISGSNVAIDDINIALPVAGPEQEINIANENAVDVFSGNTIYYSSTNTTAQPLLLTVYNAGLSDDLIIDLAGSSFSTSGFVFSDPTTNSLTIAAGSNNEIEIEFTPTGPGAYQTTLTLISNDANESSFIIHFYIIIGDFAPEPTTLATSVTFSDIKSYRFTPTFDLPSDGEGVIILRTLDGPPTELPEDGTLYGKGDQLGNAKVVSVGTGTSYFPTGLRAATPYHHYIYSFNGFDGNINYKTDVAAFGDVTTLGEYDGPYYDNIDVNATTFPDDLTSLIFTNQIIFYGGYDETMINLFYTADTIGCMKTVTGQYTNIPVLYQDPWSWVDLSFSREHVLPHSWMPSWPSEPAEYHDLHSLLPVEGGVNSSRSNFIMDECATMNGGQCFNADGKPVFTPVDNIKGDVARAMFYMIARYNGSDDWGFNHLNIGGSNSRQSQAVLLQWHFDDPPSNLEIARNDFIDSLKSNRNPFIDHPEWVCYIDFDEYAYRAPTDAPCLPTATPEIAALQNAVSLFPNPASDFLTIEFEHEFRGNISLEVMDVTGKLLKTQQFNKNTDQITETLDLNGLNAGFYLLNVRMDGQTFAKKFVVN